MIKGPATREQLNLWRQIHNRYKEKLTPNAKSGQEVVDYLQNKYVLTPIQEPKFLAVVVGNAKNNIFWQQKLEGREPEPVCFFLENQGAGCELYERRDPQWEKMGAEKIFVGIDLVSGLVQVGGCDDLYDEIYAVRGVDKYDIENCVRVADYLECLKKYDPDSYNALG